MKPRSIFCYHKCGTILLKNVFEEFCLRQGWIFDARMGKQESLPANVDVVLFGHSLVDRRALEAVYRGVHIIRDPRDVIVSGYLYHLRTTEAWCVHENFDLTAPIDYPNVPFSQRHRSEEWKKKYIESLQGLSYQENLKRRNQEEGLAFEMQHYGRWTLEAMLEWDYNNPNILEIRFEELMNSYESTFKRLFESVGLTAEQLEIAMSIAQKHNLHNKTEQEIANLNHVYSRQTSKWRDFFTHKHKSMFIDMFGDCLLQLGYENSNQW